MKTTIACLMLGLLFGLSVEAHPGSGIAVDGEGRVFFTAGSLIVMIETNGMARTIVHDRRNERFYQLHHIQHAPDGSLVTASDMGDVIWRFTPEGTLSRFYPPPNEDRALRVGIGGDPFAVDREGNIYAVNSSQHRFTQILRITPEGRIGVLAGADWGFANGLGIHARFGDLHGGSMIATPEGALLLTEAGARVRRITPEGLVTTVAGGEKEGFADGPGAAARFDGASGLAMDAQGHVIVVETSGRIRRISAAGLVSTIAGSGRAGSQGGPQLEAAFAGPTGIALAANGDIFIIEPDHHRVRKISGGHVSTLHQGIPSDE